MSRIYDRVKGTLRIEIFGAFPESLLNASAFSAIELWELECVDDNTVRASIYERDMEQLKELSSKCGCEVKLISALGGSRDRRLLRRRGWLLLFSFLTAAALLLSSLFIWEIEIRGNRELSRGEILRALSECGVEPGSYWPALSPDLVRSRMISALPDIAWMALNVNGSRAVVLITERREKPEIYSESASADVVASRAGIVRRISVLNGRAAVKEGQAVSRGELLISGTMDSLVNSSRYVRARGSVTAETWYELTAVAPMETQLKEGTGFSRSRWALVFGKRRINLYFSGGKAIDECDKIIHEYALGAEGLFSTPVKLVREELRSYRTETKRAPEPEAMRQELDEQLLSNVDGELAQQSFTESGGEGLFTVTCRARALEDIAQTIETTD